MKTMKKLSALLLVLCTLFAFASCNRNKPPKPKATLEYINHVLETAPTKVSTEVKATVTDYDVTLTSTSVLQIRTDAAGKYSRYAYSTEVFVPLGSGKMTEVVSGVEYTRGNTYRNAAGKDVLYNATISFDAFTLPSSTTVAEIDGVEDGFTATVVFDSAASRGILGYAITAQGNITLQLTVAGGHLNTAKLTYTSANGVGMVATCAYEYSAQSFK